MSSNDYESLYGVALLDDLHNYFPALLYETASFSTVQQVLLYVQSQTRRRFDLFSRGLNSYQRTQQRAAPPPSFQTRGTPIYVAPVQTEVRHRFNEPVNLHNRVMRNLNQTDELLNFFTAFLGAPQNFSNVIVRPTREQISAGSVVSIVSAPTTDICAVCQDGFGIGNERRRLNACRHVFHTGCIDTWFHENVHCPVCRHDIREPSAATGTPVAAASAPTEGTDTGDS